MADFISLEDYKNTVGIVSPTNNSTISYLIPQVSAFIKNYCNRNLIDNATTATAKTEVATVVYSDVIYLREAPIINVISISESSNYGLTSTPLVENVDYIVDKDYDAVRRIGSSFPSTYNGTKIVYTGGYASVPGDLRGVAAELLTYFLKNEGTPRRSTVSSSHLQIEYITSSNLPAHIKNLLDNYRYVNI